MKRIISTVMWASSWGILFVVCYLMFLYMSGFLVLPLAEYLQDTEWNDISLFVVLVLFLVVIANIFYWYGYIIANRLVRSLLYHSVAIFSVALVGLVIWFLTYQSVSGATSTFSSLSWLPFHLYVFWANPLFESLEHYVTSDQLKFIGLFTSLLPSLAAFVGVYVSSYLKETLTRRYLIIANATTICLLILGFSISLVIPSTRPFTLQAYPVVDGATAAIPFGKILVHQLTGVNKPKADQSVQFNTTHDAYVNLIHKSADIIFVAGPSDEEEKLAHENGVELQLTPIGKDAFVFLVHRANQIDGLTVAEIQDIYSGKVTNWKEVGGEDNPIIAFQREENSGSQTFMEKKVMKDVLLADPPTTKKGGGMGGLIEAVADYQNSKSAIGYSFYYYAQEMNKHEDVKFLAINGIEPNKENIRSAKYPYTAILYAVTRKGEPTTSSASQLLNWIRSDEGRKAVEQGGYVPITDSTLSVN